MTTLGTFIRESDSYTGEFESLTFTPGPARIVPLAARSHANAPNYRVYRGTAEVGAAWDKTTRDGRAYLTVQLDDPTFPRAIECRLVEAGDRFQLIWSRDR